MDQSKKTMRHFYCRDVLWETFEQMANDFDCSIDYLVNEAMRYYARSKNYQSPGGPQMTGPGPIPGGPGGVNNNSGANNAYGAGNTKPPLPRPNPQTNGPGIAATGAGQGAAGMGGRRPAPPTPGFQNSNNARPMGGGPMGQMNQMGSGPMGPMGGGGLAPQAQPQPPAPPMPQMGAAGPTLFLVYNGQRYAVTKDQFIIGRGSKTSDLPIKDGNISRKHAAVIRRNGTFYIKDLGSTNGIDYKGMRIDNKRIDEGDVFHLCDYELRFTYRAD
jgi:hypothetical protein